MKTNSRAKDEEVGFRPRVVILHPSSFILRFHPSSLRRGVTLIELLVAVSVATILAGATWGALQKVATMGREARTKATIAKLDHFILMKLESYQTRRVPIDTSTLSPDSAAQARLYALRDLMRMEMPDCPADISTSPKNNPAGNAYNVPKPSLWILYNAKGAPNSSGTNNLAMNSAKCLYMTVMTGDAEARQQFSQNEIAIDTNDNLPYFIDGWQRPIAWIRWPVGCGPMVPNTSGGGQTPGIANTGIAISDIQSGNAATDSDPFDPLQMDVNSSGVPLAFQLTPLIVSSAGHTYATTVKWNGNTYSAGAYDYGVFPGTTAPTLTPFDGNSNNPSTVPSSGSGASFTGAIPIHNHHIEQR
jgi:prepilin-type N-terminal cleavage/methylation domain-containing protein